MTRALYALAILSVLFVTGRFGSAETINFAGLANNMQPIVLDSAGPLNFYEFYIFGTLDQNGMVIPGTEYIYAGDYPFEPAPYPYALPYSIFTSEFYSTSGGAFTLNNMEIASYPDVEFYGYRKGVLVDQASTAAVDSTGLLTLNWSNIDGVIFPDVVADAVSLDIDSITINEAVSPEPASFVLLGTGLAGLFVVVRRRFCA